MDFETIPGPRGLPFVGNILDVQDPEAPLRALGRIADTYGPIYQLTIGGNKQIFVSSAEMMKELMDEKRFLKTAIPGLHSENEPDGLIVASTLDPDWELAHRILRSAFGPLKIEEMFDGMKDVGHQMVLKWARMGSHEDLLITDEFSNLSLDIIALCTMDFRFNSFYRDGAHPYVAAMNTVLASAGSTGSTIVNKALSFVGAGGTSVDPVERAKANKFMNQTAQEIIDNRRSRPTRRDDFLDTLLFGKDSKTGETMNDAQIAAQMQTFIVAGHETTSGMLSFAIWNMLQKPETYAKAREEVDRVVGDQSITIEHVRDMEYVYAVLQETLRLNPTAPTIGKIPHPRLNSEVVTLAGKYKIDPNTRVRMLLSKCMQDPKVFGEDAAEFKPERMLRSSPDYNRIEPYWRPFSEGSRSCVGRHLSLQEAVLALALVLQNFDLRLADPMYKMRIRQAITIKPEGMYVKATLRDDMTAADLERRLHSGGSVASKASQKATPRSDNVSSSSGAPLTILFGSNTGTCQAMAQRLASESTVLGFNPDLLDMDAYVNRLAKSPKTPTVVITASYEGEPPDNALQFVHYLEDLKGKELDGLKYAVFGVGNRDWVATFHRIPKLVNDSMKEHGAQKISEPGFTDVSQGNPMADFESWLDKSLLPELKKLAPKGAEGSMDSGDVEIEADVSTGERVAALHQDLQVGTVKDVRILSAPGEEPEKRHMEVELPAGSSYECGDYLAVLGQSPEANVRAVMSHFKLPADATISLKSKIFSPLPLNTSLAVADLLRNYYELAKPTTGRGISLALKYTKDEKIRKQLSAWLDDDEKFKFAITDNATSLFDLLKTYPQIEMPLASFLSLLPPLTIRQYSISSSPLQNPDTCTITYSVLADKTKAERPFYGVATTYLSTLKPGDRLQVATRRTAKQTFRLPLDTENVPLLMFAAGTGLAPFRGFIEQRAIQLESSPDTKLAPAYLFLGCRHPDRDRLYAEQVDHWEKIGGVKVFYAFSQAPEKSDGCKHVADRMIKEIETISSAWRSGARAYTCGNRGFAQSVGEAARNIVVKRVDELGGKEGWHDEDIKNRRAEILSSLSERAADDVFD